MTQPGEMVWPPNGYLSQWVVGLFPAGYRGHAIDVGASDGRSVNTTWALEKAHGWTVVSVEPNPAFHAFLIKERVMVEKCACGATSHPGAPFFINKQHPESFSALVKPSHDWVRKYPKNGIPEVQGGVNPWQTIQVPVKTVNEILARWEFPRLDLLCVDVEGTEVDVINGANLEFWQPRAVIAESWDEDPVNIQRALGDRYRRVTPESEIIRWRLEHPNHCFIREDA